MASGKLNVGGGGRRSGKGRKKKGVPLNRYGLSVESERKQEIVLSGFLTPPPPGGLFAAYNGNWRTKTFYRRSVSPSDGNNSEFPLQFVSTPRAVLSASYVA